MTTLDAVIKGLENIWDDAAALASRRLGPETRVTDPAKWYQAMAVYMATRAENAAIYLKKETAVVETAVG